MLEIIILLVSFVFGIYILYKIFPARGVKQITGIELKDHLRDKELQFIDVRPAEQYNDFHIYGFENIPLKEIREKSHTLTKDKRTIVICRTGSQGNEACRRLNRKGFTDLTNVRGGLSTWE